MKFGTETRRKAPARRAEKIALRFDPRTSSFKENKKDKDPSRRPMGIP